MPRGETVRHWGGRLVRVLGSAVLVVGIFWFIPFSEVMDSLQRIRLGWVAIGFAGLLLSAWVQSVQLWLLLRRVDMPIGAWGVFETNMITRFYGQFLPSELMAGAVKLYRLAGPRRQWGEVMASQVCFRLINSVVLVVLGFAFWAAEMPTGVNRWVGVLMLGMSVGLVALHGVLASDALGNLVGRLLPARLLARIEHSPVRKAQEVLRATARSYRLFGRVSVPVAALAVLRHVVGMVSFAAFALSVGIHLSWLTVGWIRVVLQAVMMLPIAVSGIGVREGSLVLLLQQYAVPPSQAVALSLVLFVTGVLSNGIGGALELGNLLRSDRLRVARSEGE